MSSVPLVDRRELVLADWQLQRDKDRGCAISGLPNGRTAQQDHHIYINSGCWNVVIAGNYMDGTPGGAVHLYHEPGPSNVTISGNTMRNGYWGVVIGSVSNGVAINGNTFAGNVVNIDNQLGSNVTAAGNSPDNRIL